MYQTKDNLNSFSIAMMLAQSYSHNCLSRTQEGWLPHMDFSSPPLLVIKPVTLSFSFLYYFLLDIRLANHGPQ